MHRKTWSTQKTCRYLPSSDLTKEHTWDNRKLYQSSGTGENSVLYSFEGGTTKSHQEIIHGKPNKEKGKSTTTHAPKPYPIWGQGVFTTKVGSISRNECPQTAHKYPTSNKKWTKKVYNTVGPALIEAHYQSTSKKLLTIIIPIWLPITLLMMKQESHYNKDTSSNTTNKKHMGEIFFQRVGTPGTRSRIQSKRNHKNIFTGTRQNPNRQKKRRHIWPNSL